MFNGNNGFFSQPYNPISPPTPSTPAFGFHLSGGSATGVNASAFGSVPVSQNVSVWAAASNNAPTSSAPTSAPYEAQGAVGATFRF